MRAHTRKHVRARAFGARRTPLAPQHTDTTHAPYAHATPTGIYKVPHFDWHFYYITEAEVEAVDQGECSFIGFLSPESYYRTMMPMPLACFPRAAHFNGGLAVGKVCACACASCRVRVCAPCAVCVCGVRPMCAAHLNAHALASDAYTQRKHTQHTHTHTQHTHQMGNHIGSATNHEFQPPLHGFDDAFIYGGLDGRVVFAEVRVVECVLA